MVCFCHSRGRVLHTGAALLPASRTTIQNIGHTAPARPKCHQRIERHIDRRIHSRRPYGWRKRHRKRDGDNAHTPTARADHRRTRNAHHHKTPNWLAQDRTVRQQPTTDDRSRILWQQYARQSESGGKKTQRRYLQTLVQTQSGAHHHPPQVRNHQPIGSRNAVGHILVYRTARKHSHSRRRRRHLPCLFLCGWPQIAHRADAKRTHYRCHKQKDQRHRTVVHIGQPTQKRGTDKLPHQTLQHRRAD